jgi:hypothetical protein
MYTHVSKCKNAKIKERKKKDKEKEIERPRGKQNFFKNFYFIHLEDIDLIYDCKKVVVYK